MSDDRDSRRRHTSSLRSQMLPQKKTQRFKVDVDKFRRKIGFYVYGETVSIDEDTRASLRRMIEKIRQDAKSDPDQLDSSYYLDDESFLSAYSDDAMMNDLVSFERKFLALTLMKVFRDNVPKLKTDGQVYYVLHTLLQLGIHEDLWNDFHVERKNKL